jgi:hypothetical protein
VKPHPFQHLAIFNFRRTFAASLYTYQCIYVTEYVTEYCWNVTGRDAIGMRPECAPGAAEALELGAELANNTVAVADAEQIVLREPLLVGGLNQLLAHNIRLTPKCGSRMQAVRVALFP